MADEKNIDVNSNLENGSSLISKQENVQENKDLNLVDLNAENPVFLAEKDVDKEIIKAEKDSSYKQVLSKIAQSSDENDESEIKNDAQKTSEKMDADSQVQHLLDLVETKGLVHAVKVAKHLDDNYVLDMLHDKIISEEFHRALVEKNIIKDE